MCLFKFQKVPLVYGQTKAEQKFPQAAAHVCRPIIINPAAVGSIPVLTHTPVRGGAEEAGIGSPQTSGSFLPRNQATDTMQGTASPGTWREKAATEMQLEKL